MRLPSGPAVTFMFTDIEGSTRLERAVGSTAWENMVARHDELLRSAIEAAGGVVVKTEGDAFFAAFDSPASALEAAVAGQQALAREAWPDQTTILVRMGLHLGEGRLRYGRADGDAEDYVGIDVNYAARIAAVGNGGQVVLSAPLVEAISSNPAAPPEVVGGLLVDEGLRAVKDFEEPARLFRLEIPGAADNRRPLRTIEAPTNLPGDVTALVGRETDIATVTDALRSSRIVTLTGPGGSGKTRLALAVARALTREFPHGTWFIDLAALRDANLIEPAIAAAIAVRESSEQPVADILRAHLRDRTVLLVLDNLEHLLPSGADIVSGLARAAPALRTLVTSRELLRIDGELGWSVPPLDIEAGVALFEDRARSHRPDLVLTDSGRAAIRAICERLGGLPLAIELAAARVRTLGPVQILDRLGRSLDLAADARDVPERQRTLRAAISWSHEMLAEPEQRLFRRLAVFSGGWTHDAAGAIVDADSDLGVDLEDGLSSLAAKSLVRIEPEPAGSTGDGELRFGLHPLLRDFALERLVERGEAEDLERRHALVIARGCAAIGRELLGPDGAAGMRRIDREAHNVRQAVQWALAHREPDLGLDLLASTWRWFQQRGRLREGRAMLAELLAMPGATDTRIRIAALAAAGGLAYWMDDLEAARAAYEERLQLADTVGDPELRAEAHYDMGFLSIIADDAAGTRTHQQQALDLYLESGLETGAIRARQGLALALFLDGEYARARDLQAQNLEAWRESSAVEFADGSTFMAGVLYRLGDLPAAWAHLHDGLRIFDASQLESGLIRSLAMASIIQFGAGNPDFAVRIAAVVYALMGDQSLMLAPVKVLRLPDPAGLAAEQFGQQRAAELIGSGGTVPRDDIIAEVLAAAPPTLPAAASAPRQPV